MAANSTAVWRARPSGNNNNGAGFDCAISSAATGTHGSFTGTTFTDATAAAFTSGMAGSAINIAGIGQYLISAFINSSNITLSSGNPALTLVGPLSWTVGSGQDYSQQNAAQVTQSGGTVSTATVTLTDTGASFTSALIGNGIRVAGTGISTTYTFVTGVTSGTVLTLQTSPGTTGTSVTYSIGGGWADFWTNTTSTGPVVPGNTVYILGGATPNPAAYSPDYNASAQWVPAAGSFGGGTNGFIFYANDPLTPGYKAPPDTTGGMPLVKVGFAGSWMRVGGLQMSGVWIYAVSPTTTNNRLVEYADSSANVFTGCVFDQNAIDCNVIVDNFMFLGCEFLSSSGGSGGSNSALYIQTGAAIVDGCNIHNCVGDGLRVDGSLTMTNTIIAKNSGRGVHSFSQSSFFIKNCTIDGNSGNGVLVESMADFTNAAIFGNIISNSGAFGISSVDSPAFQVYANAGFVDYNVYYNNASGDLHNFSYGPHDTALGSNPYVGQSTENYTLS